MTTIAVRNRSRLLWYTLALLLVGCSANPVAPHGAGSDTSQAPTASSHQATSDEEARLLLAAKRFNQALATAGGFYHDPQVQAYVQRVADGLFPELSGAVKIRILNDGSLNAFMLPNGTCYVNAGLLSRLENEAQLAAVLAHEGAHYVDRHGLLQVRRSKSTATAILAGVPLVGELAARSSIYGYSQKLERKADRLGFARLVAAGYDPRQAPLAFHHMLREARAMDRDEPWFFATHPRLAERVASFEQLVEQVDSEGGAVGVVVDAERYRRIMRPVQLDGVRLALERDRPEAVIAILADQDGLNHYPPQARYYLGEAYRRRGEPGDLARAASALEQTLAEVPQFSLTLRALGLVRMKQGHARQAREHFQDYLEQQPEALDRAYVEHYLEQLQP